MCYTICATDPQQIEVMEFGLKPLCLVLSWPCKLTFHDTMALWNVTTRATTL